MRLRDICISLLPRLVGFNDADVPLITDGGTRLRVRCFVFILRARVALPYAMIYEREYGYLPEAQ